MDNWYWFDLMDKEFRDNWFWWIDNSHMQHLEFFAYIGGGEL